MIAGFEWVRAGNTNVWCISRAGEDRMLCGREFTAQAGGGFRPVQQPVEPRPKCEPCLAVMYGRRPDRAVDPVVYGVCPVCDRWEPVADGVMQDHRGWAVDAQGPHETGQACPGVGSAPEVER